VTTPALFAVSPWLPAAVIAAGAATTLRAVLLAVVDRTLEVALLTAGGVILLHTPQKAEDEEQVGIAGALLAPVNHLRLRRFEQEAFIWFRLSPRRLDWRVGNRGRP